MFCLSPVVFFKKTCAAIVCDEYNLVLKRVGYATHPCLTPHCIRISSDNSFMILTDAFDPSRPTRF